MSENIAHFTDDNFETEVADGLTLVDFYADWWPLPDDGADY